MIYNSYSYKRRVTGFYQESQNPLCPVVKRIVVYKSTKHQFTYLIYYQVHQEIHAKQFFIVIFQLFSIGDSFNFKATQETRLI